MNATTIHDAIFLPVAAALDASDADAKLRRTALMNTTTRRYSLMADHDPHAREYAAAVGGMQETYGSPSLGRTTLTDGRLVTTWAVGDSAMVRCPDGVVRQGHVVEMLTDAGADSEYHVACHVPGRGRQHYAIKARDFTIF